MQLRARRALASTIVLGMVVVTALAPAAAQTRTPWPAAAAAEKGAAYIAGRQDPNGSLLPGEPRADQVADGVVALVAAGGSREAIDRALAYMGGRPFDELERGGQIARVVMAITAARRNPRDFNGRNYVRRLNDEYNPATGSYDPGVYGQALSILGVVAAGDNVPEMAITFLRANECRDGGSSDNNRVGNGSFGHDVGCASGPDIDTTAMVLSALVASRVSPGDGVRVRTRNYLLSAQNPSGGYGFEKGEPDNANSTAVALSAVVALGENPVASPWSHGADGNNPVKVLLSLQHTDTGGFRLDSKSPEPDLYATFQSVPPLAGVPYPVPPRAIVSSTPTTVPPRSGGGGDDGSGPAPGGGPGPTASVPPVGGAGQPPGVAPADGASAPDAGGDEAAARRRGEGDGGDDSIPATIFGVAGLCLAGAAGLVLRQRART